MEFFQIRNENTSNTYDANLCFYDLDNHVLYNLVPVEENKYIDYYGKYYIAGTLNNYKYTNKDGDQLTEKLVTGCQLFELNFEENKITSNKIFDFKEHVQYQINELDHKDILRLKTTEIKKGNALFSGKIKKDEAFGLYDKSYYGLFIIGEYDIIIFKQNNKSSIYQNEYTSSFDYQGIEEALIGRTGWDCLTTKRILVIQMI